MWQDVPHQVHVQSAVPTRGTGQKHDAHEGTGLFFTDACIFMCNMVLQHPLYISYI